MFRTIRQLIREHEARPVEPPRPTKGRKPGHLTPRQKNALAVIREGPTTTRKLANRLGISYLSARNIVTLLKDRGLIDTQPSVGGGIQARSQE